MAGGRVGLRVRRVGELTMSLSCCNPVPCLGSRVELALVIRVTGELALKA